MFMTEMDSMEFPDLTHLLFCLEQCYDESGSDILSLLESVLEKGVSSAHLQIRPQFHKLLTPTPQLPDLPYTISVDCSQLSIYPKQTLSKKDSKVNFGQLLKITLMQGKSDVPWKPLCCKGVNLKVQDSCDSFCLPYLFILVNPLLHGRKFMSATTAI